MLALRFGPDDLANVRFAISPLVEVYRSVRALEDPAAQAIHLPWITELTIGGEEGFERLYRAVEERPEAKWFAEEHALKLALFERYGAMPGAGDRHVAEFFPWALTPESGWGKSWGIHLTSIADRERDEDGYREAMLDVADGGAQPPTWASGEMVAPLVDSLVTGERRELPVNLPNRGQAPYLPSDVVVETMGVVDGDGVRGRDQIEPPAACAEWIRRHVAVQELTVEAALTGDRDAVRAAMALDPLCGRIDVRAIEVANDGGRWVCEEEGEPFAFEQVEKYQERRVRDRFTFEMLKDYLRRLGLSPFEEDFYMPPGSCAWLIQKTGPFTTVGREYTLEQARAAHVLVRTPGG